MLDLELENITKMLAVDTDWVPYLEPWHGVGVYAEAFGCPFEWREGEPPYLSLTPVSAEAQGLVAVDPPHALANGVSLAGWRIDRPNEGLRFITQWRLAEAAPEGARYHGFHHLYVGEGTEPAAVHDVPLSSAAWCAGDTLYVVADLPAPPEGAYHVEVGMYTYPDITRVSPEVVLRLEAP